MGASGKRHIFFDRQINAINTTIGLAQRRVGVKFCPLVFLFLWEKEVFLHR